jgi:hypothetical protein
MTAVALDDAALLAACDGPEPADRLARTVAPGARSVAGRDAALLALHRARYGKRLAGAASCPACGEAVEVELAVAALLPADPAESGLRVRGGGCEVEFRMPDTDDVRAAGSERELAERCVTRAWRLDDGAAVAAAELPPDAVAAMDGRMAAAHPGGEVRLTVVCPACDRPWGERLDVPRFVAARAAADAEQILDEVHALARGYGWTEPEVLALPRRRRLRYLDRLDA